MKTTLSFKVDSRIKDAILKLAEQENRSLSNYVVTLLIRHLDEKGIAWREECIDERLKSGRASHTRGKEGG